jgi:hypothetical protein
MTQRMYFWLALIVAFDVVGDSIAAAAIIGALR